VSRSIEMTIKLAPSMQETWDALGLVLWAAQQPGRNTRAIVSRHQRKMTMRLLAVSLLEKIDSLSFVPFFLFFFKICIFADWN